MKNYYLNTIFLFSIFMCSVSPSAFSQSEINLPRSANDTIAVSETGMYYYQNKAYGRYKHLKPLFYHFPESKILYKKTRRSLISSGPIILASLAFHYVISFDHYFLCNFYIGERPAHLEPCESVYSARKEIYLAFVSGAIGIFNLASFPFKRKKSIRTYNELVKSTYGI